MIRKGLKTIAIVLTLIFCAVSTAAATDFSVQASEYLDRYYANIYSEGNGDFSL